MSTLKTNNIQHVDRSEPSIIINTDGSVNIAGTVSYEDSTNVDSVGVVTARKQLHVGTGVSVAAGGLNVTAGITTVQALQATTGTFSSNVSIAGITTISYSGTAQYGLDVYNPTSGGSGARVRAGDSDSQYALLVENGAGNNLFEVLSGGGGARLRSGDLSILDKIAHYGDGNTFIRFPAADTFSVETAGSERLRITSDGKIGIGIANPDELLHIFSSSSNSKIVLEADNNSANNGIFWVDEGDNTQSEFYYDHGGNKQNLKVNGNGFEIYSKQTSSVIANIGHGSGYNEVLVPNGDVGIGTVTPGSRLDIRNASGTNPLLSLHHSNADVEGEVIRIGRVDLPAIRYHSIKAKHGGAAANNYISFNLHDTSSTTSQSEVLRIIGSGAVGIGTDAPENDLHIMDGSATMKLTSTTSANSTRLILESESDSYGGVHFGDPADEDAGRIRYYHGGSYPNSMRFATNAVDKMMIHSGGVVSFNNGIELGSGLDATAANTLDDYEEGTWSPILADNSGNTSTFGGVTSATYTKIGNSVRLSLRAVNMQTTGLTSSDPLYIQGLPFDTVGYSYGACWLRTFLNGNWGADKCMVFGYFESNKAFFQGDNGATGGLTLTVNDVSHNNSDLFFTVVYTTNA